MDIALQKVSKGFGEKQVLTQFDCVIPGGSVCGIMAPSGAGKTTLLRLILGLAKPDSGSITGVPERKAALFQEDRLCPELSVRQNIRMAVGKNTDMEPVLQALGLAGEEVPAAQLSGGMARRAALARALLHRGEMLVLDEPFNGLDEENRQLAAETINRYRGGRTLLVVTHRAEDLALLHAEQLIEL